MKKTKLFVLLLCLLIFSYTLIPVIKGATVQLHIENYPTYVIEGESFQLQVTNGTTPVSQAVVTASLNSFIYSTTTNSSGWVTIIAPSVNNTETLTVEARKLVPQSTDIYLPATITIEIRNTPDQLELDAPPAVQEQHIFTVTVTVRGQPIEDAVISFIGDTYQTDSTGSAILTAPDVEDTTTVTLSVTKENYVGDETQITITKLNPSSQPRLTIQAPTSVLEETLFEVTIEDENTNPISQVTVSFANHIYYTNSYGKAELIAPSVENTNNYEIIASIENYQIANSSIQVIQKQQTTQQQGWIYGTIMNTTGTPLQEATVLILLSASSQYHQITDEQGNYNISINPGTYIVQASKPGYTINSVYDITVQNNTAQQINIILEDIQNTSQTPTTQPPLPEIVIDWGITTGQVGAIVTAKTDTLKSTLYTNNLSVDIARNEKTITCTVSATTETEKTIIVFRLGNIQDLLDMTISDIDSLRVTLDGKQIPQASFEDVFSPQETHEQTPTWSVVIVDDDVVVAVNVGHYSEHTITISSVIETLGGTTAILLYLSVSLILVLIIVIPILFVEKK